MIDYELNAMLFFRHPPHDMEGQPHTCLLILTVPHELYPS